MVSLTHARKAVRQMADDPKEPYGDVDYADPGYQEDGKKRYPIDTEAHCRAAWSYINQADNAAKYSPDEVSKIKGRIRAAGKKYGIEFSDDESRSALEDMSAAELLRRLVEFDEAKHPRDPKGSNTGGQFTSNPKSGTKSGSTSGSASSTSSKSPLDRIDTSGDEKGGKSRETVGSGVMSYDPDTGRGTGYGTRDGDPRVRRLQEALNRLGITDSQGRKLKVDGKLGPLTTQAVKAAQRRMGVKANGRVTMDMLDSLGKTKSLPSKSKPDGCVCRSVECVDDACEEQSRSEVVEPVLEILRYARSWPLEDIEISRSHVDGRTVIAYAAIFDTPYEVRDQYGNYDEVVARSAFNKTLRDNGISKTMCLYNHGMHPTGTPSDAYGVPIGVPLEIEPDGKGLRTVTRYNEGADADRVLEAIRNGAIRSQSFRGRIFRSSPSGTRFRPRPDGTRTVVTRHELGLTDYGPTPTPVNAAAEILAVRSVWLANKLTGLDEDRFAELIRVLSPTTLPTSAEPEATTATPDVGAGTEAPPDDGHAGRKAKLAEILARVGVKPTEN